MAEHTTRQLERMAIAEGNRSKRAALFEAATAMTLMSLALRSARLALEAAPPFTGHGSGGKNHARSLAIGDITSALNRAECPHTTLPTLTTGGTDEH